MRYERKLKIVSEKKYYKLENEFGAKIQRQELNIHGKVIIAIQCGSDRLCRYISKGSAAWLIEELIK